MVQEATKQEYYYGTGKRKTAIAKVRLYPNPSGSPQILINGKPLEEAFPWITWRNNVLTPLRVTETEKLFNVVAKTVGGGVSGQSEAVRHGIARALVAYDQKLKTPLRQHGLLTRDSRIKESKKYGLKRARRAPQYTKR